MQYVIQTACKQMQTNNTKNKEYKNKINNTTQEQQYKQTQIQ